MKGLRVFGSRRRAAQDISIRMASSWLMGLIAALTSSCSSTAGIKADSMVDSSVDGASADQVPVDHAATDVSVPDVTIGADCFRSIDQPGPFGNCPSTFESDGWKADVCWFISPTFMPSVTERTCDGYSARSFDFGTHRWTCFYESAALTLVAAEYIDDTTDLCNFTASREVLGNVPTGKCSASVALDMPCGPVDAGGQ